MTTTSTITSRSFKYDRIRRLQNSNWKSSENRLNLDDSNKELEDSNVKQVKHKKCKVIYLVKEQIELLKQRQSELDKEYEEAKAKMWWNLQKNNLIKFVIASSTLLFLWSTLVLLGAAICNLYNTDCNCYNNFWFLPWFTSNKEYQLVF